MNADLPVVSIWDDKGTEWAKVGEIATYDNLTFEPRFLQAGPWSMSLPYDGQALKILADRLLTVDWRGVRTTWCVGTFVPSADETSGEPALSVSGPAAMSMLGWATAWPDATKALGAQPAEKTYSGPTETVIKTLVAENLRDRYGLRIEIPASLGRGVATTARPRFDNLLELVATKAKVANLGVDVGLVNTSGTRARLELHVWEPQDKTLRVQLTPKVGTLRDWTQTNTAPTGTRAIVGGAGTDVDRVFREVSTPEGNAAANEWGGHRELFVDGPNSFDSPELDQAGKEALVDAAATTTLALVAAEAEGLLAFRDYMVGDKAFGEVLIDASVTDVISSIGVTFDGSGYEVKPGFGDPNATEPALALAAMVAAVRRRQRALETRR